MERERADRKKVYPDDLENFTKKILVKKSNVKLVNCDMLVKQ